MPAYATLDSLVRQRAFARGFSFRSRQPLRSLLAGRHASRIRGRGLDFEELRNYVPGDDVRTIDWKATARSGEAFVRVYTEERDRPAILAVDQRINMFFGTKRATKSALAAEVAALAAWRLLDQGDRVGALIFGDSATESVRPHRSHQTVMRIFEKLAAMNTALKAGYTGPRNQAALHRTLHSLSLMASQGHLILVVSDFDGADETTRTHLSRLARSNDVVLFFVYDRSAVELPSSGELVVTDGELQLEMAMGEVRKPLLDFTDARSRLILGWQRELGVPVIPLCTWEDPVAQIRKLLGAASGAGR